MTRTTTKALCGEEGHVRALSFSFSSSHAGKTRRSSWRHDTSLFFWPALASCTWPGAQFTTGLWASRMGVGAIRSSPCGDAAFSFMERTRGLGIQSSDEGDHAVNSTGEIENQQLVVTEPIQWNLSVSRS